MQVAGQALEIAQRLEAADPQPACAQRRDRRLLSAGVARDFRGVEHHLAEARRAHCAQPCLERPGKRSRVEREVIQVHGFRWLTTSSKVVAPM